jgi:hypothetical protein
LRLRIRRLPAPHSGSRDKTRCPMANTRKGLPLLAAIAVCVLPVGPQPASAITADLAKKCREFLSKPIHLSPQAARLGPNRPNGTTSAIASPRTATWRIETGEGLFSGGSIPKATCDGARQTLSRPRESMGGTYFLRCFVAAGVWVDLWEKTGTSYKYMELREFFRYRADTPSAISE